LIFLENLKFTAKSKGMKIIGNVMSASL